MSWIWIAAACCWTGARLPFGQRPSRCCAIWSKIPAVLFRRMSCLPRCGRIWRSPTMRWCRASANCGGRLRTIGPRLIKTVPRRGYRFESVVSNVAPADNSLADATPGSAVSRDNTPALKPAIPAQAWSLLAAAPAGRRGGLFAALVVLLVAGALLVGRLEWRFLGTPRSGEQFSKTAELARNRQSPFSPL